MPASTNVAIIGAGPYGLSLSAHLSAQGVEHRLFGEPMQMWRHHMPPGMHLKSDGKSSDLSLPDNGFPLEAFCRANNLPFDRTARPISLETFSAYGMAFQARYAPHAERKTLVRLDRGGDRFELHLDDGEIFTARQVVLAVGVLPFKVLHPALADLPMELASHSSDFGPLEQLRDKDVIIVGAGSSALDLAGLLQEGGARVTMVTRRASLPFQGKPPAQARNLYWRLRAPDSKIGAGWLHRISDDAPQLLHAMPAAIRHHILDSILGPSGGYFIKDKVIGKVDVKYATELVAAGPSGSRVAVQLKSHGAATATLQADHVISATGYALNMHRLRFLSPGIAGGLRTAHGGPILSRNFESSVPGLHFIGVASAPSFGPVMRFVAGVSHPSFRLARHLAPKQRQPVRLSLADAV
jgi:cation diffusion facilitator CzcD-associated flavoprotein CzcO